MFLALLSISAFKARLWRLSEVFSKCKDLCMIEEFFGDYLPLMILFQNY